MKRMIVAIIVCASIAGCGLGETAVSATAAGAAGAEQAKEARKAEARVKAQLDAAATADAQRRQAAEAASQ